MNDNQLVLKNPSLWQVSEVVITYRNKHFSHLAPRISASIDAERIFRANWSDDMELYEEFVVLFVNRSNQPKGLFRASRGGYSGTVVDIKIVFAAAIKAMAAGIVVAHNHPSGNLVPSEEDIHLTRKIYEAGKVLDLPLLDHLILAPHRGFYSFADEGNL